MPNSTLVIYSKGSGKILKVLDGGSITKRKQLRQHAPSHDLQDVGFYYEENDATIDQLTDKVARLVFGHPPILLDHRNRPKLFWRKIAMARANLKAATRLKVDFEGGMGDQVLQLEALRVYSERHPAVKLVAGIHPKYQAVIPYFSPLPEIAPNGPPLKTHPGTRYINNATRLVTDPRGGLYGKASLYGSHLGLSSVHASVKFHMPEDAARLWARSAGVDLHAITRPLLAIHIRSGSGGAKSWNHEHAQALAVTWQTHTGGSVFLCGSPSDYSLSHHKAFTIPDASNWASVAAILERSDLAVAIDSGPMHILRSAEVPTIILWGGTGPRDILGREEQSHDIRASLPCIDNICYSCPRGDGLCMRAIREEHVWNSIRTLFPNLLNRPSQNLTSDAAPTSGKDGLTSISSPCPA